MIFKATFAAMMAGSLQRDSRKIREKPFSFATRASMLALSYFTVSVLDTVNYERDPYLRLRVLFVASTNVVSMKSLVSSKR